MQNTCLESSGLHIYYKKVQKLPEFSYFFSIPYISDIVANNKNIFINFYRARKHFKLFNLQKKFVNLKISQQEHFTLIHFTHPPFSSI